MTYLSIDSVCRHRTAPAVRWKQCSTRGSVLRRP